MAAGRDRARATKPTVLNGKQNSGAVVTTSVKQPRIPKHVKSPKMKRTIRSQGGEEEEEQEPSTLAFRVRNTPVAVDETKIQYTTGRGNNVLVYDGHRYIKNNCYGGKVYWKCSKWHTMCMARAITSILHPNQCVLKNSHNHGPLKEDITLDVPQDWR